MRSTRFITQPGPASLKSRSFSPMTPPRETDWLPLLTQLPQRGFPSLVAGSRLEHLLQATPPQRQCSLLALSQRQQLASFACPCQFNRRVYWKCPPRQRASRSRRRQHPGEEAASVEAVCDTRGLTLMPNVRGKRTTTVDRLRADPQPAYATQPARDLLRAPTPPEQRLHLAQLLLAVLGVAAAVPAPGRGVAVGLLRSIVPVELNR